MNDKMILKKIILEKVEALKKYMSSPIRKSPVSVVRADPACPSCYGVGFTQTEPKAPLQTCVCVVKQDPISYLSDIYAGCNYIRTLNPTPLLEIKKLRFDNFAQSRFKSIVKSFLLNTGMKFTHSTASGYDMVQAYLTNTEDKLFDRAKAVDLLVLYLVSDPKNAHYGEILTSLIEARDMHNKYTWIFSLTAPDSPSFRATYQPEFADYVGKQFISLPESGLAGRAGGRSRDRP